ncbi:Stk1 family PASTA domain-containing Ser/Thr kinase [Corynebacterium sp. 335C]
MSGHGTLLGGRYRLGDAIGIGGMADVYAASDELLGRDVAVKMMRADLARDRSFLERFRREAQNAARLNHPSIVAVYDTGEMEDAGGTVPYIVMELVQGETLRDIIRRDGSVAPTRAAAILADVCDALEASHEAGIIHRDIKPANIMLTNTGQVKVMDFGIARALSDTTTMTQTSAVIGTAQYLSPEQARGKNADARSDIYAIGCVLHEALTGQPPFSGETPLSVAYQHVQDPPPSPSTEIPGLSPAEATAVDAVTLTALAKDPAERYDSAREMADDLRRLTRGEVPLAAAAHIPPAHHDGVFDEGEAATTSFAAPAGATAAYGQASRSRGADFAGGDDYGDYDYDGYDGYDDYGYDDADAAPRRRNRQAPSRRAPRKRRRSRAPRIIALVAVLALLFGGGAFALYRLSGGSGGGPAAPTSEMTAIPDIVDLPAEEAERRLVAAGFSVTRVDRPHPEIARNNAIGTEPAIGSQLPNGAQVQLLVSTGPELTQVPDVRNMAAEQARATLERAGLEVDPVLAEEPSHSVPQGSVIEQSPAAGSQVSKGTVTKLTVSSGVEVPRVSGQTLESARATLESAGFVVQVREVDSIEPAGTVLSSPQEGSRQPKGSTVELEVSRGNRMRMPDLTRAPASEAESQLRSAGFTGRVEKRPISTIVPDDLGRVAGQQPAPGTEMPTDGVVVLEVYELGLIN